MEGDSFATLLEVAGSGSGPGARLRRWSVVLLAVATVTGLCGVFFLLRYTPTELDVARIEDGYRPFVGDWIGDRHYRASPYRITGHLLAADAVVFPWSSGQRMCAPIVSERPGSMERPARVYFMAYTRVYDRARTEGRFVGDLSRGMPPEVRLRLQSQGLTVGDDVYLLKNLGSQTIGTTEGSTLITVAVVFALLALGGLLLARTRSG